MISDILIPFVVIFLAELGDKTQLSVLLLCTKTNRRLQLFLGVMLAFLLVDGFAVVVGSWITNVIPIDILKMVSGAIFILFGLFIFRSKARKGKGKSFYRNPFISGFLLIFLAEWGDKTQIAAALFSTTYNPFFVIVGTMAALAAISLMAIYFGSLVSERIDERKMSKISGIIFVLIGLSFFLI